MKKITGLFLIVVAAMAFVSCEPVENRNVMKGTVTDAEISQYVSVTNKIINGKKSNYLIFKSEGLNALTSFKHGLGTYVGTNAEVQAYVIPGSFDVVVTVLNPDGSSVLKTYPVIVEETFDVAPEWAILCGTGEKAWTWSLDESTEPYGMGDATAAGPDWWCPDIKGNIEGPGASMTFAVEGAAFIKNKTDGSEDRGIFGFDMSKTFPNFSSRSMGQLTTSIPVLVGQTTGANTGRGPSGKDVLVYEIIKLTNDRLFLMQLESSAAPDIEGWGQATWWMFKAK